MHSVLLLLLIAVLLSSTGELTLKHGMNRLGPITILPLNRFLATLFKVFTTIPVLLGFALIFCGAILWLVVISRTELSWAYPLVSLGYVLVVLFSQFLFDERVTLSRWLGVIVICIGATIIARS